MAKWVSDTFFKRWALFVVVSHTKCLLERSLFLPLKPNPSVLPSIVQGPTPDSRIRLNFNEFNLESSTFHVIDGEGAYIGPSRSQFTGNPGVITSSTNRLGVYFYLGNLGNEVVFDYSMIGEGTGLAGAISEAFSLPRIVDIVDIFQPETIAEVLEPGSSSEVAGSVAIDALPPQLTIAALAAGAILLFLGLLF